MYPFTKYLKELNNEPKKDDGSDANDEVWNKLAKTVNAIDPVGRGEQTFQNLLLTPPVTKLYLLCTHLPPRHMTDLVLQAT